MCQLGRGQYGTVHLVRWQDPARTAPQEVVAKVVFLDHLKDRDRNLAHQEVEVLKLLHHPNIVGHYASWLHRSNAGNANGTRQEALVTLMEYCAGGDLRQWLDELSGRQEHLSQSAVLSLFTQLLEGISYVHSHMVLHRDLKTSNLMLNGSRRYVKIGDFGIARVLDNTAAVAVTMLGTPYYMSPEVCKGEPYREKSDMWSLGCVLYEMCVHRHAFESQSLLGLVYCIVSERYDPIPADHYSSAVSDLVAKLLLKAADERHSADDALALEILRPYLGAGGEDEDAIEGSRDQHLRIGSHPEEGEEEGGAVPPPPPPPQAPAGMGPFAPPSPAHATGSPASRALLSAGGPGLGDSSFLSSSQFSGGLSGPTPAGTPPFDDSGSTPPVDLLLPPLRRPGPPVSTPVAGGFPQLSPQSSLDLTPRRSAQLAAGAAPGNPMAQSLAQWTQAGYEAQVLLVRARGALLRRPRSRGNWVMAFARHDTTGQGFLDCVQFQRVLTSLSLGMSGQEVMLLAESLAGPGMPGVSLGVFSEAITYAEPDDKRFAEHWALEVANVLASSTTGGLAALAGCSAQEALGMLPQPGPELGISAQEAAAKFHLWLPKTNTGAVDWPAAEVWRVGAPA